MKKIRYLHFSLDFSLEPYEVSKFRGAIINAMDDAPDLFHQHHSQGVIYRYPLIQYKIIHKKPTIVCLEEGVDKIHHFFQHRTQSLQIGNQRFTPDVRKIFLQNHLLQIWNRKFKYTINNWLPFNTNNHQAFLKLNTVIEQTQYLEKILRNNIVQFAHELDWDIENEIKVAFTKVYDPKSVTYKNMHYKSYKVDFLTNVSLPNHIGLGKAASTGFGIISKQRDSRI